MPESLVQVQLRRSQFMNRERLLIDQLTGEAFNKYLLKKYGITKDEYERLSEEQGHRCAICGGSGSRRLVVDHCHETKRVRGLLCNHCNLMLGHARDSAQVLRAGAEYLEAGG